MPIASTLCLNKRNIALTTNRETKAKYGGRFMVTLLPGDGIGPEMAEHLKRIFKYGLFISFYCVTIWWGKLKLAP